MVQKSTGRKSSGMAGMVRTAAGLVGAVACVLLAFAGLLHRPALAAKRSEANPLLQKLALFTAPNVPVRSPEERETLPLIQKNSPRTHLPGGGLAQHPLLYIGENYNQILLVNQGKVQWTYATGSGLEHDDVWMLSNGNVLYTRMQYIAEITPDKKVVWRYDAPAGTEIHSCQPIGLDKVLFMLNGLPPKIMVVNVLTKKVEVEHALPIRDLVDPKTVHGQFRRVRYTAQGTYLVPFFKMDKVVEYDRNFKQIWSYNILSPWAAVRLKNGNTLITDEEDILTREVNPKGETVWELKNTDIPEEYRYGNSQTATRLANGNTIICSRGGDNQGPQLVEVTPDKKVVWVLQDWAHLGPATAVQVLDEPGYPERPGDDQH